MNNLSSEVDWPLKHDPADVDRLLRSCAALQRRADGEQGVIAIRHIAAGSTLIHGWHDAFYLGMAGWVALTVPEIDALPPGQRALFHRYGLDMDFGTIFGPLDVIHVTTLDNFINHSCEPNLGYDHHGNVVSRRSLAPGEELLIDYGEFVVNYDEPFTCRCGANSCRTNVTRNDWHHLRSRRRLPPFIERRLERRA